MPATPRKISDTTERVISSEHFEATIRYGDECPGRFVITIGRVNDEVVSRDFHIAVGAQVTNLLEVLEDVHDSWNRDAAPAPEPAPQTPPDKR